MRTTQAARYARWSATIAMLIAMVVTGVYVRRVSRAQHTQKIAAPVPAAVEAQSAGFSMSKVNGDRTQYTVRASRATEFKEGTRSLLENVWVTAYGNAAERFDNLHTGTCDYIAATGFIICPGKVQIDLESSADAALHPAGTASAAATAGTTQPKDAARIMHITTSELTFDSRTGIATTEQHVDFHLPQGDGSAQGEHYDSRGGEMHLLHDVQLTLHPQMAQGGGSAQILGSADVTITASSLLYRRDERVIHLLGPVEVTQGPSMLRAGKLDVDLDMQLRARRMVASDNPQFAGTQNGEPVSLFADEISTLLTSDGWADRVIATGHARFLTKNATAENCLDAGRIEVEFTPHTNQAHRMTAVENVIVQSDLPGGISRHMATTSLVVDFASDEIGGGVHATTATTPAATVDWLGPTQVSGKPDVQHVHMTSNHLDARFAEGKELHDLHGIGGVQVDRQIGDGVPVTSTSRELVAQFAPGGEWSTIEQTGDVRLCDADKTSESPSAHFDHLTETAALTGGVVLTDASSRTTARSGKFLQDVNEFQAEGGVLTSELSAGTAPAADGASGPAHISAEHLNVDTQTGHATYTGHARLWQDDSLVQADTIEFDRNTQILTATGGVHAIFPQASPAPSPGAAAAHTGAATPAHAATGKPDLVRAEAGRMIYESILHRARLERGAVAQDVQGTLRSTSMDLFFMPDDGHAKPDATGATASPPTASPLNILGGQSLERAIALGDVVIEQIDRRAKASRADYTAADGKFVLSGGPPTVYDATGNATTGRQLTFVFADDRIVVDSEEGSHTVTMHPVEKQK